MIKCEFGKKMYISGHAALIAAEMEEIMRNVRVSLCENLGKEGGMSMYEEIIRCAAMSEEQRDAFCKHDMEIAHKEHPEVAQAAERHTDALMKMLFGGFGSPGSVEEE